MMGLVVLGCRTSSARAELAARLFRARPHGFSCVIASGGRAWERERGRPPVVEADALALDLTRLGVPADLVVRERCSHSTKENAHYTAAILGRRNVGRVTLVSVDWHLPRAIRHFENEGLAVEAVGVPSGTHGMLFEWTIAARELGARVLDRVVK